MAGELIVADFQFQLDDELYGAGADTWGNDEAPWSGFFGNEVRDQDTELNLVAGSVAATDSDPAKLLAMPISTAQAHLTAAEAFAAARALETAWAAAGDKELHFQLGGVHEFFEGRARGSTIDLSLAGQGVVRALVKFKALKPAREAVGS